ncbi:MAG: cadherin domain-containing protein, partial [Planctomycetota bacterium]
VVGVYEQELTIRMELIANNDQVVYTDAGSDPYTNNNGFTMLAENQANLDAVIGNANYDIGHVFSTGGGGVASLGSVGVNDRKGRGVTGLPAPTGDPFYVDFVSHEIGHQFGGNHTFNGDSGACSGARWGPTAFEPGSGTTIQAYAGICGDDDLQQNSDPHFHAISLDEILAHVDTEIPNVGSRRPTGNTVPFVEAGTNFAIPANTPFGLTAQGLDPDGDTLTYSWEQMDLGPQQDVNAGDNGSSPLFRSWVPSENPTRYFPRLQDIVNNTTVIGETIPTTTRELNFRVTARDNRIGAGGVSTDDIRLNVFDTGSPFQITSHNTPELLNGLSFEPLTWDVAATDIAPISATEVSIYMSADGGLSFPFLVAENVANDGQHEIIVPNVSTTQARFMVRGSDNFFFDITDANASITAAPIGFDLGPTSPDYVENSAPVAVAPQASVINPTGFSYSGLTIEARFETVLQAQDRLRASSTGNLSIQGNQLFFSGQLIGSITSNNGQRVFATLNGNASDDAVNTFMRSVAFSNVGDNPGNQTRTIEFIFGQGLVLTTTIGVIPTNDSPVLLDTDLPPIFEDTQAFQGARVSDIFASTFTDVDNGSSMLGIAIVGNEIDSAQGQWYYSVNTGGTWLEVGTIEDLAQSIVLDNDAQLAFLPAADFFGHPAPLQVAALDNTYTGNYSSTANNRVPLEAVFAEFNGAASQQPGDVSIHVININDAPIANAESLELSVLQGQPIDQILEESLFTDIDSPNLLWSLRAGAGVPAWLTFDPATRALNGTPENRDVGTSFLTLSVRDQEGATANIPVVLTVVNINDAPIDVRLINDVIEEGQGRRFIGGVIAIDPDTGDELTWEVSDNRFTIEDDRLWVNADLDFETEQQIPLILTVTDSGSPPLATSLAATIRVTDVNEFTPTLDLMDLEIQDELTAGSVLFDVDSVDGDFGANVTFSLLGPDQDSFHIDPQTGLLTITEDVDYRTQSQYRVFVQATDDGTPMRSQTGQMLLDVLPVNLFAPIVLSPQNFLIAENSAPGAVVGTLEVTDNDNHGFVFALSGSDQFEIDTTTGEIRLAAGAEIDFETQNRYELVAEVIEDVPPHRNVRSVVAIDVVDLEDNPYVISVPNSNVPIDREGMPIGEITVEDGIGSPTSRFELILSDPRFQIVDGVLRLAPGVSMSALLVGPLELEFLVQDSSGIRADEMSTLTLEVIDRSPWTNLALPADVNRDGAVSGIDALIVINEVNVRNSSTFLSRPRRENELALPDFDVSGDGFLTALDALIVIDLINRGITGEGEGETGPGLQEESWLSAFDQLEQERKERLGLL